MIDSLLQLIDLKLVLLLYFDYLFNLLFHQLEMIPHQVPRLQQRLHCLDLFDLPLFMLIYLLLFNCALQDVL